MQDKLEQDQAREYAEGKLKAAYPSASLKDLVRQADLTAPLNASIAHEFVFLADFGDGYTSEVTAIRSANNGWEASILKAPHGFSQLLQQRDDPRGAASQTCETKQGAAGCFSQMG